MGKRPRIAFWGNFGTGNWGNECTLQAILANARERVPEAELLCICSEPADTRQRHGLKAFPISDMRRAGVGGVQRTRLPRPLRVVRRVARELREWARTLAVARSLDAVIMTGTGMLTDDAEGSFGLPYDMFKWSVATKAWGGKLVFSSVGVEPIRGRVARFFIVSALRLADYRSYRDLQSRGHLGRVGFASGADAVYPDLAFSLPQSATALRSEGPREPAKVAVGIYGYLDCGAGGADQAKAYREYLTKVGSFIMWLLAHGHAVRVIIGDLTYDEPVLADLRALLETLGVAPHRDRIEDQPAASVDEVMRQIADADIVVASRFHNVLLALLLGKPVLSISYNEKNDALMAEMGLADYCQTIDHLDADRLIEQFVALERNGPRLRSSILAKGATYREQLNQQYEALFGDGDPASGRHAVVATDHATATRPGHERQSSP